jgi:hypothetical protein
MDHIVAAALAGFAVLIVIVLFRRHKSRAGALGSSSDPFFGVQRYAGQGDVVGIRGDPGHHGTGKSGGDGGND